jgi:hypothetical protein
MAGSRLCQTSGRSAIGLIQLRREDGTRPGRHSDNRIDSKAPAGGLGRPCACLLTEKHDVPTAYRTFSSASCSISSGIDRDPSLLQIASSCLIRVELSSMPRRWMISPKRRLSQTPNKSTIADVGLVQHGLCGGFAPHESYSLARSWFHNGMGILWLILWIIVIYVDISCCKSSI